MCPHNVLSPKVRIRNLRVFLKQFSAIEFTRIAIVVLLASGLPACGQSAELDSAELTVRNIDNAITDFGFRVGALWECVSHAPTGAAKVVNKTK